uniref:28S ribosomal protein S18c, mitochondrial n=1 Tax=Parastrongyloides trichosuri TaxID=131310 RepID=A0A0N4ZT16_PARTI
MFQRSMNSLKIYSKLSLYTTPRILKVSNVKELEIPEDIENECITLEKNPYAKEKKKCLLCEHKIELDYKNTRLLQQFVSSFSGRIYDRHITGLCDHQHKRLIEMISISRKAGYMPIFVKEPKYLKDPKLFDPLRPIKNHSYA